jgi:hypothetical protein
MAGIVYGGRVLPWRLWNTRDIWDRSDVDGGRINLDGSLVNGHKLGALVAKPLGQLVIARSYSNQSTKTGRPRLMPAHPVSPRCSRSGR